MFKFKLESDSRGNLKFRADADDVIKDNIILKRALFESKFVKSNKEYPYLIPMKYFIPIISNLKKEFIDMDQKSILSFLEFSDEYEEQFYYIKSANAAYMKKWREENCPEIYKINIDKGELIIQKEIAFEKLL